MFGDAPPRLEEFFAPLRERPGGVDRRDVPPLPRAGDLDHGLDLDRDVERQLTGADRRARCRPASGPQTSSTRSVNPLITAGGLSNPGAHCTRPSAAHPPTRSRSPRTTASDAKIDSPVRRAPRSLLDVELISDATGHQHLVAVDGQMAGDVGVLAAHLDQVERELDPRRGRERSGLELELGEPVGDPSHLPGSLALGMSEVAVAEPSVESAPPRAPGSARARTVASCARRRCAACPARACSGPHDRAAGRRAAAGRCRGRARDRKRRRPPSPRSPRLPRARGGARRGRAADRRGGDGHGRGPLRAGATDCADATSASSRRPSPTRADR